MDYEILSAPPTMGCLLAGATIFVALASKPTAVRNVLAPRVRWDTVQVVQGLLRCKAADTWFSAFPFLGNEIQYVLLLPMLAWFMADGGSTARLFSLAAFVACYLSNAVKTQLKLPRPPLKLHVGKGDSVGETARQEHERIAEQYGFPSTHSAHAMILSRLLAEACLVTVPGRAAFVVAHTAHVVLSRLYMGVHSLADVSRPCSTLPSSTPPAPHPCPLVILPCARLHAMPPRSDRLDESPITMDHATGRCAQVLAGLCIGALLAAGGFAPLAALCSGAATDGSQRAIAGYALAIVAALLLFPDKRGSTYEETVSFAGVHLGLFVASCRGAWSVPALPTPHSSMAPAAHFVVGLVALGVLRTAVSAAAKQVVRRLVPAGPLATLAGLARVLLVNAAAAWWVMAIHPSWLVAKLFVGGHE